MTFPKLDFEFEFGIESLKCNFWLTFITTCYKRDFWVKFHIRFRKCGFRIKSYGTDKSDF